MDVTTTVIAAEVYPAQARVTRRGVFEVAPGAAIIRAVGIPLGAQPATLRASGRGSAKARLLGARLETEQLAHPASEQVRALETELEFAQDADTLTAARLASVERELKQLDAIGAQSEQFARGLMLRGNTVTEAGAVFDFIRSRTQGLQELGGALTRERRDLQRKIDQLRRQLQALRQPAAPSALVGVVELEVETAGELMLELTYIIDHAGWTPTYDMRLGPDGLRVEYLAQVQQHTGEDWQSVQLVLSTAQPALAERVPELEPWYVSPRPPLAPMRAKAAPDMLMARAQPAPAAGGPQADDELPMQEYERTVEVVGATVDSSGASLTFTLEHGSDVPGGGDPRTVLIGAFGLTPELDYVTAPRLEPAVYRRAKVRNDSPYTLLPGPAQIFEGQTFLGQIPLEYVARGQEVELFLGADGQVRVERELTQREVDKSLFGDRRKTRFGYKIAVNNLRQETISLLIRDQLPVATDEQIKIKLEVAEPKPASHTDLNQLEWRLPLVAGAAAEVRFTFSIEHPRAMVVVGL